jgi:hypothetical protein
LLSLLNITTTDPIDGIDVVLSGQLFTEVASCPLPSTGIWIVDVSSKLRIQQGSDKVVGAPGLQTEVKDYESAFFKADEAMRVATFQVDRYHREGRRAGMDDGRQKLEPFRSRISHMSHTNV